MIADTPVLIVGAGPVGLTMATFLHHHNVPFRIIDKRSGPTTTSNAVAIHARTLELLKPVGVLDALMQAGKKIHVTEIGAHQKQLAEWELSHIDSEFPYALCVPQCKTEAILIAHLEKNGIDVERDCKLVGLKQSDSLCTAQVKGMEDTFDIACDWLAACDGYHSAVRDNLDDVDYAGEDLQQRFLMIDAPIECHHVEALEKITVYANGNLTLMMFPMLESVRLVAEVSKDQRFDDVTEPDEKLFKQIADECLPYSITVKTPLWRSQFHVHERLANHYRFGRVFLCGDAGHAHSPAGGQGMNTGMQDAINLAWKLALVFHAKADEVLLDSYEIERRPVAKNVIDKSGKMTQLATSNNPFVTTVRNTIVPLLASFSGVQNKMANELGETSIHYPNSPINEGERTHGVNPGDLCPIHELRANNECVLLDFNGDASTNGVQVIPGTTEQAELLGLTAGGYCLIRPDGYIAYIGHKKPSTHWLR